MGKARCKDCCYAEFGEEGVECVRHAPPFDMQELPLEGDCDWFFHAESFACGEFVPAKVTSGGGE